MTRTSPAAAPRRGRRTGGGDTRADILEAARKAFADKGFDGATMRSIASDAGVDAALVHHYFGSKEDVFVASMQLPIDPAELVSKVLAGDRDGIGERFVRAFLGVWESPEGRGPFLALIRSAMTNDQAAAMLREFVTRALLGRVVAALDVEPLRVEAAAAQMVGAAMLRYVVQVEPLVSASPDELAALLSPGVQRFLVG
jgi:AcrR family transcriptional regulator